ncbi:MAG: flagellar export protein FliJ [Cellvibrionaceae bacterium]|nr:flagellar export protein FliJ [Cellvibrionaceae bacterium]
MPEEKRSQRLQVVVDIAEQTENEAAAFFDAAKSALHRELSALESIDNYYADYHRQFSGEKKGVRAADLMKSREFLTRLAQMRDAQRLKVDLAERDLQAAQEQWHKSHLKHKGLNDLIGRYRSEECRQLDIAEQKHLDEWITFQR